MRDDLEVRDLRAMLAGFRHRRASFHPGLPAAAGSRRTLGRMRDGSAPVASRKAKGDLAEAMIFADLISRGHKVALPYGEDWDFDLIVCRGGALERLQVKYTKSNGEYVEVKCFSASLTNGRVRKVKRYTAATVDWIGVYDLTTASCYYVPSGLLAGGRTYLHLRLKPSKNGQRKRVRWARDFRDI
jgi:hypothetical protein